jgi:hypothetical protein
MTNRPPPFEASRETLRHEHAMLDRLCEDLVNRAESGDCRECDAVWDELGRVLEAHMGLEEATLLPVFGAEGPEQARLADQIRREHQDIRRTVARLGVAVQVHTLRAGDVRELVELLRRHAALEDGSLYAWADRVSPAAKRSNGFASEAPLAQAEPNLPPGAALTERRAPSLCRGARPAPGRKTCVYVASRGPAALRRSGAGLA